jgi:hypothetical protein
MAATTTTQVSGIGRGPHRNFTAVWCFLLASLPVAATELGLIPIYESQRRILPACASFFCFLGFAYIFSLRHGLARAMFGGRLASGASDSTHSRNMFSINHLPACLIMASLGAAAVYLFAFESGRGFTTFPTLPRSSADAVVLALSFVAIFLLAEAAFAIMAVREYLQDVLGLSDAAIIAGTSSQAQAARSNPASDSLAFSYRVIPPARASEGQLSQFESERRDDAVQTTVERNDTGHIKRP